MSFIYETPEKNVFSVVAPDAPRKELPHPNVNMYRGNHYYASDDEEDDDSAGVMSISELMTPNPNVNLYRGNHYNSSDDEDDDSAGVMSISELMTPDPDPNVNMYRGNHYYASDDDDDSAGIMSISELTPDNAESEDDDEDEDESQTDIYEQIHPNPLTNVTVRRVHRIPYEYEDSSDEESTTGWVYANRVNIIGYDE